MFNWIRKKPKKDDEPKKVRFGPEEIADEVGIPLELDEPEPAPANRTDEELDIEEDALLDLFKELLVVDIGKGEIG